MEITVNKIDNSMNTITYKLEKKGVTIEVKVRPIRNRKNKNYGLYRIMYNGGVESLRFDDPMSFEKADEILKKQGAVVVK